MTVVSVLCGSNLGTSGTLIFSEKIWSHLKPVAKIQVDPFLKSGWMIDWIYPLMLDKNNNKSPVWEWFIPPIKIVIWGMVYYCFTHIVMDNKRL